MQSLKTCLSKTCVISANFVTGETTRVGGAKLANEISVALGNCEIGVEYKKVEGEQLNFDSKLSRKLILQTGELQAGSRGSSAPSSHEVPKYKVSLWNCLSPIIKYLTLINCKVKCHIKRIILLFEDTVILKNFWKCHNLNE